MSAACWPPVSVSVSAQVLALLQQAGVGGLTDGEGAALLGRSDRLAFGRRRYEWRLAGLVAPSEMRRVDKVGPSMVWVAVPPAPAGLLGVAP